MPAVTDRVPWRTVLLLVGLTLAVLVYGAHRGAPMWDDAWLYYQGQEGGADSILAAMGDRPVLGWIWSRLFALGVLDPASILLHLGTWAATGLFAAALWGRFFPAFARFAPVAAVLAVAPVLGQTQLIRTNPVWAANLPSLLGLGAVAAVASARTDKALRLAMLAAPFAIIPAALLSEYGVLATLGGVIAFVARAYLDPAATASDRRRIALRLGALALLALLCYLAYHALSQSAARTEVRPEVHLSGREGWKALLELPLRAPIHYWQITLGQLLACFGDVALLRGGWTLAGVPLGVALAAIGASSLRARDPKSTGLAVADAAPPIQTVLALALALLVHCGIITLVAAQKVGVGLGTRLWLPVLPLAACLTLSLVLCLVRERLRVPVVLACLFVSGFATANAVVFVERQRRLYDEIGAALHARIAPEGLTAVVLVNPEPNPFVGRDAPSAYQVTAALSRGWPEADARRLWVGAYSHWHFADSFPSAPSVCGAAPELNATWRGTGRKGPIRRLLWISFPAQGGYRITETAPNT